MTAALSAITAIVVVEMILRLPILSRARCVIRFARKSSDIIAAKHVSDTWKERALLRYSREILVSSLTILVCLLLISAVVFLADMLLRAAGSIALVPALISPLGLVSATLAALVYAAIRRRFGLG